MIFYCITNLINTCENKSFKNIFNQMSFNNTREGENFGNTIIHLNEKIIHLEKIIRDYELNSNIIVGKREDGTERSPNAKFAAANEVREFVMKEIGDKLKPLAVGAMTSAVWKLLKANDSDASDAKKAFKADAFIADYNAAKKSQDAKKAEKKTAESAATIYA